jgi:AcrR family transcriptional regulator
MPPRATRAEAQARTRADLLAAAARVFARRGYDAATVADVAAEAGYSHGAVYSNFAGKEDLFLALYEDWVAQRTAALADGWPAEGDLARRARVAAEQWLRHLARHPEAFLLRLEFSSRAARDPALRRKLGNRTAAVPVLLERLIEEAAAEEGVELAIGAAELAQALQALSLGFALEAVSHPRAGAPEVAGRAAQQLVDSVAR